MKGNRSQRVNSEYQREISAILSGTLKHREPDLKGIVSVTGADVAPDLKTAKIYISVLGADAKEQQRSLAVIRENAGFIRHELSLVMRMRTVPLLTFIEDGSMAYGSRMDQLLDSLNKDKP